MQAKDLCDILIVRGYSNTDLYYLSGETHRQIGDLKTAEDHLIKALTYDPEVISPYVYNSLGLIFIQKQDWKKAV